MAVFSIHNLFVVSVSVFAFAGGVAFGFIDGQQVDRGVTPGHCWTTASGTNEIVGCRGVQQELTDSVLHGGATVDLTAEPAVRCGFDGFFGSIMLPEPSVVVLLGTILVSSAMRRRMKAFTGQ